MVKTKPLQQTLKSAMRDLHACLHLRSFAMNKCNDCFRASHAWCGGVEEWRSGGGQATLAPMQSSDTRGCWSCLYYTPRPSHRVESAASAQTCRRVALRLLHWPQKQELAGCSNTCHLNRTPATHARSAGHWLQYPVAVIVGAFVVMAQAASGRPPCLTKQAQLQRV